MCDGLLVPELLTLHHLSEREPEAHIFLLYIVLYSRIIKSSDILVVVQVRFKYPVLKLDRSAGTRTTL